MNNVYLIPANSKKSMLYFGLFNQKDLIILGVGLSITMLGFMLLPIGGSFISFLVILPAIVSAFLVFPIPNYHNVRTFILVIYHFLTCEKGFVWKGWCFEDDSTKE